MEKGAAIAASSTGFGSGTSLSDPVGLSQNQSQYRPELVDDVLRKLRRELEEWCEEESRARMKRKHMQVRDQVYTLALQSRRSQLPHPVMRPR
jgi:hypothetical protein